MEFRCWIAKWLGDKLCSDLTIDFAAFLCVWLAHKQEKVCEIAKFRSRLGKIFGKSFC